jgi:hypothetical protein
MHMSFVGAVLSELRAIVVHAVALETDCDDSIGSFWRWCGLEACTDEQTDTDAARTEVDRPWRVCARS